ncbi:hypothetical protein IPL85_06200 [Candidatus Saccharibacteria bacterium]|nr:MAG: hypothetical protein IPL85_06200 [Candidatus Saccharibacteria bacterium]
MAKHVVEAEVIDRSDRGANKRVRRHRTVIRQGGGNSVYSIGMIGAAIYYISTATGFWMGAFGLLKALVWPAFLVYHAMKNLGM